MSAESNKSEFEFGLVFGVVLAALFFLTLTMWTESAQDVKDAAVKHHAAEYYIDSHNNKAFRWLDEEKK